jgi:hypothetical protein
MITTNQAQEYDNENTHFCKGFKNQKRYSNLTAVSNYVKYQLHADNFSSAANKLKERRG